MLPTVLTEYANAKVNLFLHVVGRRPDNYHVLDSLAVFSAAADKLDAHATDEGLSLTVSGEFADQLVVDQDNLVFLAARALAREIGAAPRASLRLEKRLPVASGIGGGSADAAATLRLLTRLWGLTLTPDRLINMAALLGADVPVCLAARPARMGGIGDVLLAPPALPDFGILLVNPGVWLSTAAVFRARHGPFSQPANLPLGWENASAMAADLADCTNDLEAPAVELCPEIAEVLAALRTHPDCLLARMSGSGATCFGIFPDHAAATIAAARLKRSRWWCAAGVHARRVG